MKSISISKLSAGSGSSKVIEKGRGLIVTSDGNPVAIYRPLEDNDKGKKINAGKFYDKLSMCMQEVHQGKKVLVTRRGTPFATLCPYVEKPKASRPRAKRRPKAAAQPPTPPPLSKTKGEVAKDLVDKGMKPALSIGDSMTRADEPETEKEPEYNGLEEAIELLSSAAYIPQKSRTQFLALGSVLADKGKLKLGIRMLQLLLDA